MNVLDIKLNFMSNYETLDNVEAQSFQNEEEVTSNGVIDVYLHKD